MLDMTMNRVYATYISIVIEVRSQARNVGSFRVRELDLRTI